MLAAFAAGPTAVYAAPDASDGGGDQPPQSECEEGAPATASADTSAYATDGTVTITGTCFPGHKSASADILVGDTVVKTLGPETVSGDGTVSFSFKPSSDGSYVAMLKSDTVQADVPFTVEGAASEPGEDGEEGEGPPPTTDPGPGVGDEPGGGDEGQGNEDPDSGDDGQEQDGDDSGSGEDDQEQGDDDQNSGDDGSAGDEAGDGSDSSSDEEQNQDSGNGDESGNVEGSDEEQQGGDTTASGSHNKPVPGDEEDGETSASAANDNASSTGNGLAQPPAAPGSATNDFPAAQQEATADQKQSAALAVLMTKLFAGGVSTGSVGTTPDQARAVIDPSADASEIEVPAGSDNGSSSDSGSGSESSDGDALAATGSNMLVPAGIAAAAILLGAGLKIHQIRRGL
ncbi:hypothetical protein [Brachybacterium paraconglomeratum]|uniref:hypothetical protein n=1 Tax=Brachybacterium paraconglomeratum TaxID=173362 RepID=UPI001110EBE0|nr:hypothetical protein [Brachybacterium paraconglomeratum]